MFSKEFYRQYRNFQPGEFIIVFVDTAGEGQDWNSGHFLSRQKLDIPMVLHYQGSITDVTPRLADDLNKIYDITGVAPVVAYETNNGGGYELERLERLNRQAKYIVYRQYKPDATGTMVRSDKMGWNTNSSTRPLMLSLLQDLIKNNLVKIYDRLTVDEMYSFTKHQTPSGWRAEAEHGTHDDLIMALAGVWQLYQTETPPETQNESYDSGSFTSTWI